MTTAKLYDVFLSHASADKPAVEALAERLSAVGLEPFLDKWHLVPGEPWQEALEEALDQSCTCAVFLGPGDLGPWQNEEMRSALAERVVSPAFRVIPVLLPEAPDARGLELPRFLRRLTWVDFRGGLDDEETFDRLLCGILGIAPGPAGKTAARPPRVEARLEQIPRDVAAIDSVRSALGDELAERRLGELQAELERLRQTPPIQFSVHVTQASSGSTAVGGDVTGGVIITGDGNTVITTVADPGAEKLVASYHRALAKECSELPLGIIDTRFTEAGGRKEDLSLPEIYVDLDVVTPSSEKDSGEDDPRRWGLRLARGEGEGRTPVLEAVAAEEHHWAVLLGDAGSGKTTFAHYLAYLLARGDQKVPESLRRLTPVRLVLREVAAVHLPAGAETGTASMLWSALEADLARCLGEESARRAFEVLQQRLLTEGGFFLFDGLDEVPEARQRRHVLLGAVRDLARSLPERSRLLVTARPYAYANPKWKLKGFSTLALAPFDADQVERFVGRWYAAMRSSRKTSEDRSAELTAALGERPYLGDLASRPLLLTLMATLHSSWGKLPEDRADLYEEITKLLLGRWQVERTVKGKDGEPVVEPGISETLAVGLEPIRGCLEALAFRVHERQRSEAEGREEPADISDEEVLKAFKPVLGKVKPDDLTKYLRDRAGLLMARREEVYAFPHRSFQEYLAGAWLTNRPDADLELSRRVAEDPTWWREAFLLAVGKVRQGGLTRSVAGVRALLAAGGEDRDLGWRLMALAGDALLELRLIERAEAAGDLPAYEKLILNDVRAGLTELVTGGHLPPAERLATGDALARLGDRRPGVGLVTAGERSLPDVEWIEIPSGEFRMGSEEGEEGAWEEEHPAHPLELPGFFLARYPVTNAQFGAFLEAGGYDREDLWTERGWAWRQGVDADLSVLEEEYRERWRSWLENRPKEKRGEPFFWRESRWNAPTRPVVGITWYEALAFCRWLDGELRESSWWRERVEALAGWQVRVPSEAEWEKAARGGEGHRWPWGDEFGEGHANTEELELEKTSPVGMFPSGRNPYGLDDVAGNVWEWTLSRWGRKGFGEPEYRYPYDPRDGREDLTGPDLRVVRGGSWFDSGRAARCASRSRLIPAVFDLNIGFRCGVFPG